MRKLSLLLLLFAFATVQAQSIVESLERNALGQGKVTIHQDPSVEALLGAKKELTTEQRVITTSGYRVQVYTGNNTSNARNEANVVAARVKEHFPELKVYTFFFSPRRVCRVGDFRSIEEADAALRKLKSTGVFKEVYIVKDQISIPL